MKKLVLATALLASTNIVNAAESVRWDSVSFSYRSVDFDLGDLKGFAVGFSKLLGDSVFLAAELQSVSDDVELFGETVDTDLDTKSFGIGYKTAISATTDFYGLVSLEDIEVTASLRGVSESVDDNGYGIKAGVRSLVSEKVELGAALDYIDYSDGSAELGFDFHAMFNLTEQFSLNLGYNSIDETDTLSLGAIFFF